MVGAYVDGLPIPSSSSFLTRDASEYRAGAEVNLSSHWWNLLRHRHEIRCLFAVAKGQGGEENAQDRDGIKPGKLALRRLYLDGTRVKMEPDMYEGGRL